ncbi:BnaC04g42800D [Brassica napus]|uniref:BnaC04g42800D protein n=1 Tax=Brassica napus TaxID=3708 RepID=A0A078FSR0_BRANA|nr:BnaC04g42800D [Brassica napus]
MDNYMICSKYLINQEGLPRTNGLCSMVITLVELLGSLSLEDSVYTTHGGLFQSSSRVHEDSTLLLGSLEELDKVDRRQVGENDDGNITLNHVLWSCPWMADGLSESNYKGLLWGADCTESFLKQSNLKMIMKALMQDQIEKTWETCYADTQ